MSLEEGRRRRTRDDVLNGVVVSRAEMDSAARIGFAWYVWVVQTPYQTAHALGNDRLVIQPSKMLSYTLQRW